MTKQTIYLDRGTVDLVPVLVVRQGDKYVYQTVERTVSNLRISTTAAASGSTGGYGSAINSTGKVLLNLNLAGIGPGIFVLD